MPGSRASQKRPTVVVVDDDPAVLSSLKFSLEIEGFSVQAFSTGTDLLALPALPQSGCLVIDHNLPEMNGVVLLDQLRQRGSKLPAILITSHPSPSVLGLAVAAGITIVEKPLLGSALIDAIRKALGDGQHAFSPA